MENAWSFYHIIVIVTTGIQPSSVKPFANSFHQALGEGGHMSSASWSTLGKDAVVCSQHLSKMWHTTEAIPFASVRWKTLAKEICTRQTMEHISLAFMDDGRKAALSCLPSAT
jgi:hypothetical protein